MPFKSVPFVRSQIVGVLGATLSGGDAGTAAAVAANATQYNFLGDHAQAKRDQAREKFNETHGIEPARELVELEGADHRSDSLLSKYRTDYGSMTYAERAELNAYLQVYTADMLTQPGATKESVNSLVLKLLKEGPTTAGVYQYAGTTEAKNTSADAMRAQLDGWFDQLAWTRPKTENELVYRDAQGYLRINNEQQGLSNLGSPAIYGVSGPLGTSIRAAAAANGVLQIGAGGNQALNGDLWNAAGNIVLGALAVAGVGVPGVRLPKGSGAGESPVVNPRPGSTLVKATAPAKNQEAPSFSNQFPEHPIGMPTLISDTKLTQGSGKYNYVVLEDGRLVIGRKFNEVGGGHIDLANGKPVVAAGEVKIVSGKVKYVDNTSGHYEPSGGYAQFAAEKAFAQKGIDISDKYVEKVWVQNPDEPRAGAWVPK